ncbi:MAG: hypothetical protein ACYTX0_56690, partial [Nostoc sp.]
TQRKIPITTIIIQTNLDSTIAVSVGMGIAIAFWAFPLPFPVINDSLPQEYGRNSDKTQES